MEKSFGLGISKGEVLVLTPPNTGPQPPDIQVVYTLPGLELEWIFGAFWKSLGKSGSPLASADFVELEARFNYHWKVGSSELSTRLALHLLSKGSILLWWLYNRVSWNWYLEWCFSGSVGHRWIWRKEDNLGLSEGKGQRWQQTHHVWMMDGETEGKYQGGNLKCPQLEGTQSLGVHCLTHGALQ